MRNVATPARTSVPNVEPRSATLKYLLIGKARQTLAPFRRRVPSRAPSAAG